MEFIIKQNVFSKALSDVGKAVSLRTLLPILAGIKIVADKDGITLIGSNSDIIIERTISVNDDKVEVIKTGSVVVSAKYLVELIKKLPEQIHIKSTNNQIHIKAGTVSTQFNGFQAEEYPSLPIINGDSIHIPAEELKDAVKTTAFATAKNETRPVLTGVNLTFTDNSLTSVATDSQRLALKKSEIDSTGEGSFVVPSSSIDELAKLVNHYSGMVEIQSAEGYIHFKTDEFALYSRLIAGHYPNTSALIPTEVKTTLVLSKETLIKGIDRACLFAGEWKNNNVSLSIHEQKLSISSGSSEMGNIQELQEISSIDGEEELKISVDGYFLLDALKTIKDSEIKIKFSGSMKPIVIESAEEESSYLHLISPVRSY
ncbi:DNA polymerase III subunit beta [Fictibacillus nanhaiensis]|uniref:DNA polymerase III subunit beta n=1 Tax=Fictibacillus nanhaiensis TaxID=742169 RepID=UPI00203A57E4|nr:DNA polymerase III subunit beta [Fictibacillus nanhaiensis]MCM3733617.1 DNA polymerase III subunit beta [Fictibacillus nanhaiensis]